MSRVPYPGIRVTTNGNQLVSYYTEARIADGGVFYPITPSTEMGENFQLAFAEGRLNVFGGSKLAVETEGEHSAQGGAIAFSVCGKRTVNFTSGQGVVYGSEQFYHAPGKLSTMVLEVAARALTKHALNVHCGHDDIYAVLDAGWIMLFAKDAQQAADQALIIRRVTELALVPGINIQDGFLTSHLERTFFMHEAALIREFLGAPDDIIACPTGAQRALFGPTRRRVPRLIDLANPLLLGPVQNQEHYMNGVVAHRTAFYEPVMGFLEQAYTKFAELTGRQYGLISCYRVDDAETVFVSIGSAAENIEAAVDLLRGRGERAGSVHVNVLRPFPEVALVRALAGKRHVIVLERTDQPLAGDNPLARDLRVAFTKALEGDGEPRAQDMPSLAAPRVPRIFSGVYGLGSRDFRPEGILGAYGFATGRLARQDGRTESDGTSFFVVGVDHPYQVKAAERPSLLPEGAIAVRLHSIGGWGMITTGKNLGEIIGALGEHVAEREGARDEFGRLNELVHVSANPKYGSEKKGAPTEYFLVVAPQRIRVNCDLRHVTVVLCCDPKAFTHTNPLDGMEDGGAFVWESEESPAAAWTRIPPAHRQTILDRHIRVYLLPGFTIARGATDRADLQLRMQGNAFLGAFFKVSGFLGEFGIDHDHFVEQVEKQYRKKFGRFGQAVVASNMRVMLAGFEGVGEIEYGAVDAPDRSAMRGDACLPVADCAPGCVGVPTPASQERAPVFLRESFDREFRAGLGYHQPASVYAAAGVVAAGTGATASKYVARRQTPVFIAENCTQCMDCITSCPDTALPNTAQDLATILSTAIRGYVSDARDRERLLAAVPDLDAFVRAAMLDEIKAKRATSFTGLLRPSIEAFEGVAAGSRRELLGILETLPLAYAKTNAVFATLERKSPGSGGLFSIFVSDLCKGCGECVTECGDHQALTMVDETEALNARHATAVHFLNLLPDTPQKFLGLYDAEHPQDSKEAALKNHLMVRSAYDALVSGDAACAGCGEKSILHAVASLTEAFVRPLYHKKAERLRSKAEALRVEGEGRLAALAARNPEGHTRLQRAVAHLLLGLGGENEHDTEARLAARGPVTSREVLDVLRTVMTQDAFNHHDLQAVDGRLANGMSVMAMAAHTGCNTVYGSTPPNNPHPYPWMNSLFQDGATVAWLFGESFVMDHARRSVIPERLADAILDAEGQGLTESQYFDLTHFTDALMTPREIAELPKAWAIGGDGGMGDIGFQNVSKVVLQNRPNVKLLMLDTQVYSNTGGQNSDSSLMTGGFDMNQLGLATQGKLIEKKGLAEIFVSGHGSPYVAQVSMANVPKFYKAILDALEYRGTAFLQTFTTCQPEHGVADDVSTIQAQRARDARLMPEFTFHPSRGESYQETLDLKGNPAHNRDWWEKSVKATGEKVKYTVAHYAATEARFRQHLRPVDDATAAALVPLDNMLTLVSQDDVVSRRVFDNTHRSFIPDFGVSVVAEDAQGRLRVFAVSRQLVLLCVERRKAWRLLQSKAGVDNVEYRAQRALLARLDKGELSRDDLLSRGASLVREFVQAVQAPAAAARPPVPAA